MAIITSAGIKLYLVQKGSNKDVLLGTVVGIPDFKTEVILGKEFEIHETEIRSDDISHITNPLVLIQTQNFMLLFPDGQRQSFRADLMDYQEVNPEPCKIFWLKFVLKKAKQQKG